MRPTREKRPRTWRVAALVTCIGLASSCVGDPAQLPRKRADQDRPVAVLSSPPEGFLLASSFEQPVCGFWWRPKAGCEFGVEGDVIAGAFDPRTGTWNVRIQRMNPNHMGVVADVPLPDGHGFIGVAHRVPAFPEGAIPAPPGHIQLEQLSPTDGRLPGWPVEVRIYPDRRLGLALFGGDEAALTDWAAPVDEWFYVVVEVVNGVDALQRMWVYDSNDELVAKVSARLDTRQTWPHAGRTAIKIGGTTTTLSPMETFADDWYVSTRFRGPLHIGPDGEPAAG